VSLLRTIFLFFIAMQAASASAVTRHYYIAAEDVDWDYAPSKMDLLYGQPIPQPWFAQTNWKKTRFIEYTDATFSTRKAQPEWLGILGPVIRAEVGDSIEVEFLNRGHLPHSIHPHGLRYDKNSEGAFYLPGGAGSRVLPGGRFTYHWFADEGSGPGKDDPSSVVWWYHPHSDEASETNAGLLGPIIVTAKGKARADGSPKDVDREFVAAFMIFDELHGKDAGLFHAINGYVFGNLPGLVMKKGDKVRWYLMGMGNEKDLHTPHWHGKTVRFRNRNTDVVELLPASMVVADMLADNPGTWLFHCQVTDHMEAGMMAVYTIYEPRHCDSPIGFVSGSFWESTGKFHLTVRNTSSKPIKQVVISFDHLITPLRRRRPYEPFWNFSAQLAPGQEQTFEMPGYKLELAKTVSGWVLYPRSVVYANGSTWRLGDESQCFEVFWQDKNRPQPEALPPLQVELNED
jgi:manganese oxidase